MSIINEPSLKPINQRIAEGTIIAVGLTAIGFFTGLVTLAVWYYAGQYFYNHLFIPAYFDLTVNMLRNLVLVAVAAFVVMFVWAQYNLAVYGRRQRRMPPPHILPEDVAKLYNLDPGHIPLAQGFKSATLEVQGDKLVLCSYEGTCFSPSDPAKRG
jgi:poly-beta-1,6-N-acetyl-D-glucosamine biosynthesis protein PgaD